MKRKSPIFKIIALKTLILFIISSLQVPGYAQAATVLNLPVPGNMVYVSPSYAPVILRGVKINPQNPFQFEFIVDPGDSALNGEDLKFETTKLVKYFLASLTVPEKDLWVNLSPYEKDRIIPNAFGLTEMGRDLLAQDYVLKQITASLSFPENELGAQFWKNVQTRAYEEYGITEVPVNAFNKVWILPDAATVYENEGTAFIIENRLKVMLEQDYLALAHNTQDHVPEKTGEASQLNTISADVVRSIIIPELEKEVNEGENFVQLRQMFHSLVLAAWYKKRIKDSILSNIYVDKMKLAGVDVDDPAIKQKIYEQYIETFKLGAYNYIKEEYDPSTQSVIPRKYFSGGVDAANITPQLNLVDASTLNSSPAMRDAMAGFDDLFETTVNLAFLNGATGTARMVSDERTIEETMAVDASALDNADQDAERRIGQTPKAYASVKSVVTRMEALEQDYIQFANRAEIGRNASFLTDIMSDLNIRYLRLKSEAERSMQVLEEGSVAHNIFKEYLARAEKIHTDVLDILAVYIEMVRTSRDVKNKMLQERAQVAWQKWEAALANKGEQLPNIILWPNIEKVLRQKIKRDKMAKRSLNRLKATEKLKELTRDALQSTLRVQGTTTDGKIPERSQLYQFHEVDTMSLLFRKVVYAESFQDENEMTLGVFDYDRLGQFRLFDKVIFWQIDDNGGVDGRESMAIVREVVVEKLAGDFEKINKSLTRKNIQRKSVYGLLAGLIMSLMGDAVNTNTVGDYDAQNASSDIENVESNMPGSDQNITEQAGEADTEEDKTFPGVDEIFDLEKIGIDNVDDMLSPSEAEPAPEVVENNEADQTNKPNEKIVQMTQEISDLESQIANLENDIKDGKNEVANNNQGVDDRLDALKKEIEQAKSEEMPDEEVPGEEVSVEDQTVDDKSQQKITELELQVKTLEESIENNESESDTDNEQVKEKVEKLKQELEELKKGEASDNIQVATEPEMPTEWKDAKQPDKEDDQFEFKESSEDADKPEASTSESPIGQDAVQGDDADSEGIVLDSRPPELKGFGNSNVTQGGYFMKESQAQSTWLAQTQGNFSYLTTGVYTKLNPVTGELLAQDSNYIDFELTGEVTGESVIMSSYGESQFVAMVPPDYVITKVESSTGAALQEGVAYLDTNNRVWQLAFNDDPGMVKVHVRLARPGEIPELPQLILVDANGEPMSPDAIDALNQKDLPEELYEFFKNMKERPESERGKAFDMLMRERLFYYTLNPNINTDFTEENSLIHELFNNWIFKCDGACVSYVVISMNMGFEGGAINSGFTIGANKVFLSDYHAFLTSPEDLSGRVTDAVNFWGDTTPYNGETNVTDEDWQKDLELANAWTQKVNASLPRILQNIIRSLDQQAMQANLEKLKSQLEEEKRREEERQSLTQSTSQLKKDIEKERLREIMRRLGKGYRYGILKNIAAEERLNKSNLSEDDVLQILQRIRIINWFSPEFINKYSDLFKENVELARIFVHHDQMLVADKAFRVLNVLQNRLDSMGLGPQKQVELHQEIQDAKNTIFSALSSSEDLNEHQYLEPFPMPWVAPKGNNIGISRYYYTDEGEDFPLFRDRLTGRELYLDLPSEFREQMGGDYLQLEDFVNGTFYIETSMFKGYTTPDTNNLLSQTGEFEYAPYFINMYDFPLANQEWLSLHYRSPSSYDYYEFKGSIAKKYGVENFDREKLNQELLSVERGSERVQWINGDLLVSYKNIDEEGWRFFGSYADRYGLSNRLFSFPLEVRDLTGMPTVLDNGKTVMLLPNEDGTAEFIGDGVAGTNAEGLKINLDEQIGVVLRALFDGELFTTVAYSNGRWLRPVYVEGEWRFVGNIDDQEILNWRSSEDVLTLESMPQETPEGKLLALVPQKNVMTMKEVIGETADKYNSSEYFPDEFKSTAGSVSSLGFPIFLSPNSDDNWIRIMAVRDALGSVRQFWAASSQELIDELFGSKNIFSISLPVFNQDREYVALAELSGDRKILIGNMSGLEKYQNVDFNPWFSSSKPKYFMPQVLPDGRWYMLVESVEGGDGLTSQIIGNISGNIIVDGEFVLVQSFGTSGTIAQVEFRGDGSDEFVIKVAKANNESGEVEYFLYSSFDVNLDLPSENGEIPYSRLDIERLPDGELLIRYELAVPDVWQEPFTVRTEDVEYTPTPGGSALEYVPPGGESAMPTKGVVTTRSPHDFFERIVAQAGITAPGAYKFLGHDATDVAWEHFSLVSNELELNQVSIQAEQWSVRAWEEYLQMIPKHNPEYIDHFMDIVESMARLGPSARYFNVDRAREIFRENIPFLSDFVAGHIVEGEVNLEEERLKLMVSTFVSYGMQDEIIELYLEALRKRARVKSDVSLAAYSQILVGSGVTSKDMESFKESFIEERLEDGLDEIYLQGVPSQSAATLTSEQEKIRNLNDIIRSTLPEDLAQSMNDLDAELERKKNFVEGLGMEVEDFELTEDALQRVYEYLHNRIPNERFPFDVEVSVETKNNPLYWLSRMLRGNAAIFKTGFRADTREQFRDWQSMNDRLNEALGNIEGTVTIDGADAFIDTIQEISRDTIASLFIVALSYLAMRWYSERLRKRDQIIGLSAERAAARIWEKNPWYNGEGDADDDGMRKIVEQMIKVGESISEADRRLIEERRKGLNEKQNAILDAVLAIAFEVPQNNRAQSSEATAQADDATWLQKFLNAFDVKRLQSSARVENTWKARQKMNRRIVTLVEKLDTQDEVKPREFVGELKKIIAAQESDQQVSADSLQVAGLVDFDQFAANAERNIAEASLPVSDNRESFSQRHDGSTSKQKGAGLEFADYRQYTPGDDLRFLDWHQYARGRMVVKKFDQDQEITSNLVLNMETLINGVNSEAVIDEMINSLLVLFRQTRLGTRSKANYTLQENLIMVMPNGSLFEVRIPRTSSIRSARDMLSAILATPDFKTKYSEAYDQVRARVENNIRGLDIYNEAENKRYVERLGLTQMEREGDVAQNQDNFRTRMLRITQYISRSNIYAIGFDEQDAQMIAKLTPQSTRVYQWNGKLAQPVLPGRSVVTDASGLDNREQPAKMSHFGEVSPTSTEVGGRLGISEQGVEREVGGIDFNPANLNLKIENNGQEFEPLFDLDPENVLNIEFDGLAPVIINIAPVSNLPLLLGMTDDFPENDESDGLLYSSPANKNDELEFQELGAI